MKSASSTELVEPVIVDSPAPATILSAQTAEADDWLCAWCLNRVADDKDRFQYDGRDEFSFTNPEGIRFDIITFATVLGCRQTGQPTFEHTWFPDHAWSFCLCGSCGQHLGWYYSGPQVFVGLIKGRIVRGQYLRN